MAQTFPSSWAQVIEQNALLYPEKKGDVLGVAAWNSLNYTLLFGAPMKGGFILSPMNPRLKPRRIAAGSKRATRSSSRNQAKAPTQRS